MERMKEFLKHFKDHGVPGFLSVSRQGPKNHHYYILIFANRAATEAYVNSSTFGGLITIGPVSYIVLLASKFAVLTTADARDCVLNDRGGPEGCGLPSLTDAVALTADLLEGNFHFDKAADVKLIVRSSAQFDNSSNTSVQGANISWYPAVLGVEAPEAARTLPYIMKVPGSTRQMRGKQVATFLLLKHLCFRCAACDKLGHEALAPTCTLSPT